MFNKKYRLAVLLTAVILIFASIKIITSTGFMKTLMKGVGKFFIEAGIPSYVCYSQAENATDQSLKNTILSDLYPSGEYYRMYAEQGESCQTYTYIEAMGQEVIAVTEEESETQTQSEEESTESAQTQSQSDAPSSGASEVISRNVITGTTYDRASLNDYNFTQRFYTVTSITSLTTDIFRPLEFLDKDMTISHDASTPQILIFHTHSQETFIDSVEGDDSTSILGVGDYLTELLTQKGYNVIHDRSIYDYVDGKLDRSKAYTYAEQGIEKILEENPSIEVVIDLHRDGVADTTHLVTEIDGKQTAKIMFFNGLSYSNVNGDIGYLYNPFRDDNLAMSLQMHLLGEAYYPGFLRRIYINAYRYCLHERGKSMLIEAGAQTNTVQEVKNAMEPLSDMLDKLLRGERAY